MDLPGAKRRHRESTEKQQATTREKYLSGGGVGILTNRQDNQRRGRAENKEGRLRIYYQSGRFAGAEKVFVWQRLFAI